MIVYVPTILLTIAAGFAGWYLAERQSRWAGWIGSGSAAVLLMGIGGLAITGAMDEGSKFVDLHRWGGHALVISVWLLFPLSLGILLRNQRRHSAVGVAGRCLLVLLAVVLVLWTSFTGYLNPDPMLEPNMDERLLKETRNRFFILHCLLMPAATCFALVGWAWCLWFAQFRPRESRSSIPSFPRGNS